MASKSYELREFFHLAFLRHLGTRLSGRSYAVKGGICLRLFHRSPRLSEDMDLDIVSQVRVETLRNAIDAVIHGRAMLASMMPMGVTEISATKPKQTETTQRWKVALRLSGDQSLPTKVEFSRRRDRIEYSTGIPDSQLLKQYKMIPFAAQYYDATHMAAQKILALAAPARNALRDFFDLHHLLFTVGSQPADILPLIDPGKAESATKKVMGFAFEEFRKQVVPYLTSELVGLYRDASLFDQQKDAVAKALIAMVK
jgi:predicted nucleotidyltransferase component of viral defense system